MHNTFRLLCKSMDANPTTSVDYGTKPDAGATAPPQPPKMGG